MSLTRPFYLRPVGGVRLRVDTWAGAGNSTDISLILPKKAAIDIFSKRENSLTDLDFTPREYHPKGLYITCLSAILSSSFAGVLFFATFISQTGSLLGQEFADRITGTFERLTRAIAWGIPPATVAVAYLIIFGWLYSFVRNLIRHKNFVVRRRKMSYISTAASSLTEATPFVWMKSIISISARAWSPSCWAYIRSLSMRLDMEKKKTIFLP